MKLKIKAIIKIFFIPNIVYVLFAGLLVRLIAASFGTLRLDQGTFIAWGNILAHDGFKNFYNGWSDYLPGYLYVLWLLAKINLLGIISQAILYKLPAIIADTATALLIYRILIRIKNEKWGLIGSALYLFNPAVFANSTLWGQVDSLTSLFSILSIYLLPFNPYISSVSLSVGTLIKPQTAFIFPVILFMVFREKWKPQKIFAYSLIGLFVFIIGFVPLWNHGNLISFILERLKISLGQYPYTSINAFNFWGVIGFWKPDNIYFQFSGYFLVALALFYLNFKLWKRKLAEYYLLTFVFAATFIFFTRMHERHLLPLFAPLTIIAIDNPIFVVPLVTFSSSYIANLYYAFIWISQNFKQVFSDFVLKLFSVINITSLTFIFYAIIKNLKLSWPRVRMVDRVSSKFPKINLSGKKAKLILYGILIFAFITRIFDLTNPPTMYFDEVYHAFTAKIILSPEANKAWEWWNTPPEGFAYEWTHPPLAKLGMAFGMIIFGQNSFGWRIPGAILGTLSVLIVYLIAKSIFEDEAIGIISAAVFSLDGLALVMSRIGMNDSYILFFSMLSIYLFMKSRDFWSAVSFGLAISSKWSAIWAVPILGILWLWRLPAGRQRKIGFIPILWFLLLPFTIYLLTYFQMFLTGHDLTTWWGMQEQMWWYHTGLKATHPYESSWWTWPLLIRPIYLYTSSEIGGWVSRIYAFGNPVVFWFGVISVAASIIYAWFEKNKYLAFVVFGYLIFFVPWAASPRIMFLYHYLPSIPFMVIASGYVLRRNPKIIFAYLFICLLAFIYFYPHWVGLSVPLWLDKSYYWVASWR